MCVLIIAEIYKINSNNNNVSNADLVINEVCASNLFSYDGKKSDVESWIEIYNPTGNDIFLGNYYLSDRSDELKRYRFPDTVLEAGEYYLVGGGESRG